MVTEKIPKVKRWHNGAKSSMLRSMLRSKISIKSVMFYFIMYNVKKIIWKKYMRKKFILQLLAVIFGLNFLWEISQMWLYRNHTNGFADFILMHIKATLGDLILFMIIYLLGTLIFHSARWFIEKKLFSYIFTAVCGLLLATLIERYALATGRWQYNDLMPIIPFLKVGLSPILQMIILPWFAVFFLSKKYQK